MDVAILGASGDCGREIAAQLSASRLLLPTERLQLVGRADGPSARVLFGLVADLQDAHAEFVPTLDVALQPGEIVADIWVVSAGATMPTDGRIIDRQTLGANNARVFSLYADALARYGQGTELAIVVSNPVELGVAIFSEAIGRDRVIGIGAFQDTQRFRREIAADLGVRRQRIGGFMLGEHGDGQIPVWSSVKIHGLTRADSDAALASLRPPAGDNFAARVAAARAHLVPLLDSGRFPDAFAFADSLPPDVRVVARPFVTHFSGAKTVRATARVTVDLLQTLLDGREALIAAQYMVKPGEFHGVSGPFGVPLIAGPGGVRGVVEIPMNDGEIAATAEISRALNEKCRFWKDGLK